MARPKKDYLKPHVLTLRVSDTELDVINTYAEKAGLSRSAYLRRTILGKTPSVKYEIVYNNPEILKIFRNLGNIAGNLNQIARHLNQGDAFTRELKQEVSGCIAQILHIRDQVKDMVGEYRGNGETHSDS